MPRPRTRSAQTQLRRGTRAVSLLGDRPDHPTGIPRREYSVRHIARDDAPSPDDRAITDAHTREDERAPADPDVGADVDWPPILVPPPLFRVEWVQRREDLHAWPKQRKVADAHAADVEHDAVEVEEHALA